MDSKTWITRLQIILSLDIKTQQSQNVEARRR
jgi:hypothetical protein